VFIWFTGGDQALGYGIFMAGGVMWLILQEAEKNRIQRLNQEPKTSSERTASRPKKTRNPRQSDRRE
jgi:hypothetical protein